MNIPVTQVPAPLFPVVLSLFGLVKVSLSKSSLTQKPIIIMSLTVSVKRSLSFCYVSVKHERKFVEET